MRALLSIVAIAALAAAAPDSRCSSLDTACADFFYGVECGTVRQCVPKWEKLKVPVGNDTELCATCKKVVQEARDQLLSNLTQDELRQVLEGSCDDLIPVSPFNRMCKKLMDTFQEELNDMLVSRMDPTQVCTVSGLCWKSANSDIELRASELYLRKSASKSCTTCTTNIDNIASITKFVQKGDMVEAFSNACQKGGFPEAKCDQFAQTYVAKFIHQFQSVPSENTCKFFGRCDGLSRPMGAGPVDSMECEFCEAMIHKVVAQFNNTSMKQQVKTVLTNICKRTGEWAAECQEKIDNDFDKAYDELISLLDPVKVCALAGICNDRQSLRSTAMMKLAPAEVQPAKNTAPAVLAPKSVCGECQKIAGYIVIAVNDNRTEENIKAALEKTCELCPEISECQQFIDTNIDKLYVLLRNEVTADHICKTLGLCATHLSPRPVPVKIEENVKGCGICSTIVDFLVHKLENNRTEAAILAALESLEKVCKIFPNDKERQCENYIEVYGGVIIDMILRDVSGNVICAAIGLCAEARPPVRVSMTPCEVCQRVAGYIVDAIGDNRTEENIKAVLEKSCKMCPEVAKCQQFIDDNIDQLFELLRKEVTVDEICMYLGLCASRTAILPVPRTPKKTVKDCGFCSSVVDFLMTELKDNSTDAAILDALERVCKVLPVDRESCENDINVYGQYIISMIQRNVAPDVICHTLGFCAAPRPAPSASGCTLCQMISGYVIDELKDNKTDEAILEALEKSCTILPVDRAECKNTISVYGSQIIALIQNNLTPEEICSVLQLCAAAPRVRVAGMNCELCETVATFLVDELKDNKTDQAILEALTKVCKIVPSGKRVECQNDIKVYGAMIISLIQEDASADEICAAIGLCAQRKVTKKVKGANCEVCKMIAGFLVDALKDDKTDAAIIAALEKVCKVVPVDSTTCENYIDVYGNMIINMIKNNASADEICSALGLCSASGIQSTDSQACPMCQIAVQVVEAELQNNSTQKEIEEVLEKACSLLPANEQMKCRNMVSVYTAYIIDMIENLATPEQICQTLKFCPTPPTPPKCEVCLFITNFVESELGDHRTEAEIQKLLDKVCDYLPNMDVPQCKETINQFSDMIITLLVQSVPPRKICEEIKMCPPTTKLIPVPELPAPKPNSGEECAFCKWLVTWVDEKLEDNRTEAVIIDELGKACDLLKDAGQCKDMVNDYVDMIVKMLVQYADPEKICEAIKKCPPKQLNGVEPPCRYCRYVIDELRDDFQKTETELKQKLEGICRVIPVDQSECQTFVNQYADQIIKLILSNTDPEKICEILGVCRKKIKDQSTKCNFCKEVMQFVTDEVRDETTDDEIVALVSKVCNYVPKINREDCQRFIEVEGLVIVRMIGESLDADSICEAVKFCPDNHNGDKLTCTWCQYALHFLQDKLYDNSTQRAIQEELDRMCTKLPKPMMSAECREFVDTYGPSLEVIVAQDLDPSVICPAIHACPARKAIGSPVRRPTSQKCHDCVSTLRSFRHNPTQICVGASTQFAAKCVGASSVGLRLVNAFESDFKICQYAKACFELTGSFNCNRGGCQHIR